MGDLFSSSVVAAPVVPLAEARFDTWRRRKQRRVDNEGSTSKVLLVPCQQVRCHENLNKSIKICVCIVRDGVQMVLPVSSQQTRLQFCGCLKIELKLLSGNWKVPTRVCDEHVP